MEDSSEDLDNSYNLGVPIKDGAQDVDDLSTIDDDVVKLDEELLDDSNYNDNTFEKFRPKLKEVWKTTQPFRHELNQIPYDYTVKVMNRFKGLNLVESA